MYHYFRHRERLEMMAREAEEKLQPAFDAVQQLVDANQAKVIRAFQQVQVHEGHLHSSTGYGYDDLGREGLDRLFAAVFEAEAALVRPHFVSGTHAIAAALFGVLRPGDELLYITGEPYDTLQEAIGGEKGSGSLLDFGITSRVVPLSSSGELDCARVAEAIQPKTRVVALQRSCGYSWRSAFGMEKMAETVKFLREIRPNLVIFVDNCYGEFTEEREPTAVGVDLMAGSLIKNPGGGLAPSGGYIAGRKELVKLAANRLTAPGIGGKVGAMLGTNRLLYQGLFLAPHIVGEALRGALFISEIFARMGYETRPAVGDKRSDIIQAIRFNEPESCIRFCQAVQKASPVDSMALPHPSAMPGYEDEVIMAAGTFVQGGSLELSADAPMRKPYIAYVQGGLTYSHVKYAVLSYLETVVK